MQKGEFMEGLKSFYTYGGKIIEEPCKMIPCSCLVPASAIQNLSQAIFQELKVSCPRCGKETNYVLRDAQEAEKISLLFPHAKKLEYPGKKGRFIKGEDLTFISEDDQFVAMILCKNNSIFLKLRSDDQKFLDYLGKSINYKKEGLEIYIPSYAFKNFLKIYLETWAIGIGDLSNIDDFMTDVRKFQAALD
jgi:hypothetical protein